MAVDKYTSTCIGVYIMNPQFELMEIFQGPMMAIHPNAQYLHHVKALSPLFHQLLY